MTEHVIHFHCQIDQSTTERFRDCCLDAIGEGASSLLLNLSTTYLDKERATRLAICTGLKELQLSGSRV